LATWPDERWQPEVERRICRLHFLLQEPRLAYAALRDYAVAVRRRELGSVATNGLSPSVLREEGDHWLAQGRAATALTLYDELVEIARGTEDGDYAAFQAAKCLSAMGMGRASLRLLAELARREGNGTWIMKARDEAVAGFVSSGKFEEAVLMTEHLLANSTTAGIRAARMYELAHLFYAWGPAHHGQSVQWLWRILALHPSTPAGASALTLLERIANLRLSALTHPVPPASPTKESP
jgi:tetratricopeptide (TPR) repeat protein